MRAAAQQLVPAAFQVKATREGREMDVLVLTAPEGASAALKPATGGPIVIGSGPGRIRMINSGMLGLALTLRRYVNKPVVDETGLTGSYDFSIKFAPKDPDSAVEAVRQQLGLRLTPGRRKIEYLVVRKM